MGLDPISLGLAAVGAAASIAGTISGGVASKNAANYQAVIARNNQLTDQRNARYAAAAASETSANESQKAAATLARVRTAEAANGVDVNSGSALDVQESQRETGKLDTLTAQNNAILQAYGYRSAATSEGSQAELDQSAADEAVPGAVLGATGTLLGDASSLGFKWSGQTGGDSAIIGPLAGSPAVA